MAVTAVSSALTEHVSSPFQSDQLYSIASAAAAPFPGSFLASNKDKPSSSPFPIPSPAALFAPYQYAKLSSPQKHVELPPAIASSQSDVLYQWHLPHPNAYGISWMDQCSIAKSQTDMVLLGWLGARQKHLRRYADWYTSRGFHDVTFTFPMADVISYKVWASGFSAALLKKQSVATRRSNTRSTVSELSLNIMESSTSLTTRPEPAVIESALLVVLEKFFKVILNSPTINRRLCDVLNILTSEQPKCTQLYIYSSTYQVIPAESVESFVERQRRAGLEVRACDFLSSPRVDHFRNKPALYNS